MKYRTGADEAGHPQRLAVLDDVTAEIPERSLTLLMGPSGSGKSTLLRLLNRLDDADGGEITVQGRRIADIPVLELRRRVVMVGQQPAPFPGTVAQNLAYGLKLQNLDRGEIEARSREALEHVGLPLDLLHRPADRLSVGQQQRMCLARALALRPQALLLDEPTAALDPASADRVLEHVLHLHRDLGLTIVYVTHRLPDAQRLGGELLILAEGKIVERGEAGAVLSRPRSTEGQAFLSSETNQG